VPPDVLKKLREHAEERLKWQEKEAGEVTIVCVKPHQPGLQDAFDRMMRERQIEVGLPAQPPTESDEGKM
jgi:hypothetical protein